MRFFHLTKTISQKQNYKAKQTRLVYLEIFPELRTLMELGLCFEFGRWCCLCWIFGSEWYFYHGVSVLRPEDLLRSKGLLHWLQKDDWKPRAEVCNPCIHNMRLSCWIRFHLRGMILYNVGSVSLDPYHKSCLSWVSVLLFSRISLISTWKPLEFKTLFKIKNNKITISYHDLGLDMRMVTQSQWWILLIIQK